MGDSANSRFHRVPWAVNALLVAAILSGCAGTDSAGTDPLERQLVAEIALQRGEYETAIAELLELADSTEEPEAARRATQLAFDFRYDVYALPAVERWVELEPENQLAHLYLGRMLMRAQRTDDAFFAFEQALGPAELRDDTDYVGLAADLNNDVPPEQVRDLFELFLQAYPETPGILLAVADSSAQLTDYDYAVDTARLAVQIQPDWFIARVWLANYLLAADDVSAAFEQMAFALETNPGLDLELEFVSLLARAGEEEDARGRLARLAERYPNDPELLRRRAALAVDWGDYPSARGDYGQLLAEAWYVNESFWQLGQIEYRQANYLEAIRYFQRVTSGPWLQDAVSAVAQSYRELGEVDTALAVFRELGEQAPERGIFAAASQAEIMQASGRLDESLDILDELMRLQPWNQNHWNSRGIYLDTAGRSDEAVDALEVALDLAPGSPLVLNNLGYTLLNTGDDYDEALEFIQQALIIAPNSAAYLDSLGWAYYKLGDTEAAVQPLQRAHELTDDPVIAAHYGEVLWELGRQDEAIGVLAEAIEQHPDNPTLNATLDRYTQ